MGGVSQDKGQKGLSTNTARGQGRCLPCKHRFTVGCHGVCTLERNVKEVEGRADVSRLGGRLEMRAGRRRERLPWWLIGVGDFSIDSCSAQCRYTRLHTESFTAGWIDMEESTHRPLPCQPGSPEAVTPQEQCAHQVPGPWLLTPSPRKKSASMEKWLILGLGQEIYKMILEHVKLP